MPAADAKPPTPRACTGCSANLAPDDKFCDACGRPTSTACAKCGATNRDGAKFCKKCGAALSSTKAVDAPSSPAADAIPKPPEPPPKSPRPEAPARQTSSLLRELEAQEPLQVVIALDDDGAGGLARTAKRSVRITHGEYEQLECAGARLAGDESKGEGLTWTCPACATLNANRRTRCRKCDAWNPN